MPTFRSVDELVTWATNADGLPRHYELRTGNCVTDYGVAISVRINKGNSQQEVPYVQASYGGHTLYQRWSSQAELRSEIPRLALHVRSNHRNGLAESRRVEQARTRAEVRLRQTMDDLRGKDSRAEWTPAREERNKAIRLALAAGLSKSEVSKITGVTLSVIYRIGKPTKAKDD